MATKPFFRRRKVCPFSSDNSPKIDYKDTRLLQRYISERGKIGPSRIPAASAAHRLEPARPLHRAHATPRPPSVLGSRDRERSSNLPYGPPCAAWGG